MTSRSIASTCIAGEYFVAAELSRMGHIALLTLRNTDRVDILVSNAAGTRSVSIQVKTQRGGGRRWPLHQKLETAHADGLFYVFVTLRQPGDQPEYYVVPSKVVADEIRENHRRWLATPGRRGQRRRDTTMRTFAAYAGYRDKWDLLGL